ncbi:Mur ligase domain-containing protein, partial [Burkholderia sola]
MGRAPAARPVRRDTHASFPNRRRPAARKHSSMHIHILGICGTFMGGLAVLAREAGHTVTGCDAGVYPPMSTQL